MITLLVNNSLSLNQREIGENFSMRKRVLGCITLYVYKHVYMQCVYVYIKRKQDEKFVRQRIRVKETIGVWYCEDEGT